MYTSSLSTIDRKEGNLQKMGGLHILRHRFGHTWWDWSLARIMIVVVVFERDSLLEIDWRDDFATPEGILLALFP